MFSELDLILKEGKGCGIVLLKEQEKIKEIEDYIEEHLGNRYFLVVKADDIGVLGIDEFFENLLNEFGVSSLKEFAQKLEKEGKGLLVLIKDIDKLSFEQLKGFEKLCTDAKDNYSLFLLGNEKIKDLINSFYLKKLRKSADILIGCGDLKKEEIKGFTENFLKELFGRDIKLEKDVDSYLYKISQGNEKKLERFLKKISENIKEGVLSKEHLKDYIVEKEESKKKEEKEEDSKKIENTKNIPVKPVIALIGIVFFIGAVFLLLPENNENIQKETKKNDTAEHIQQDIQTSYAEYKESISQDNTQEETQVSYQETKQDENLQNQDNIVPDMYFPLKRVIYLREEPDRKSKIVARIRSKSLLEMTERDNDWIKIKVDKGGKELEGWVERKNLVKVPVGKAVITARALNLREHPSLQSKVLTTIPYGNVVDVLDSMVVENKKWYKVMYIDQKGDIYEGWVSGKFVIYRKGEEENSP